jgi:uncharacterized membrane protein YkvA (DUF1232 family)
MQRVFKDLVVLGLAGVAALYLINPTAGILEFIPDNFPMIGNLDEAAATLIILNALRYYGVDLSRLFGRSERETVQQPPRDRAYRPDSRR